MKKDQFLKLLQARLIECGLTQAAAEKETEHVRTYLAESSMDEVDISVEEMAEGILAMLNDNSEETHEDIDIAPIPMVSEETDESVSDELSAAIAAIDSDAVTEDPVEKPAEQPEVTIPIVLELEEEEPAEPEQTVTHEEEKREEAPEPISMEITPAPPAETVPVEELQESPDEIKEEPEEEITDDEIADGLVTLGELGATLCDVIGDLFCRHPQELTDDAAANHQDLPQELKKYQFIKMSEYRERLLSYLR